MDLLEFVRGFAKFGSNDLFGSVRQTRNLVLAGNSKFEFRETMWTSQNTKK